MTYRVYYRTGGTDNFRWQFTNERHTTREDAQSAVASLARAGYPAHYAPAKIIEAVGLPETFSACEAPRAPYC